MDMQPGAVWECGGPVVVRTVSYADGTNTDCVLVIGYTGVAIESPPSDFAYLDQGFTLGVEVSAVVLLGLAIVRVLRSGVHEGD